jgi:hypothetical protein
MNPRFGRIGLLLGWPLWARNYQPIQPYYPKVKRVTLVVSFMENFPLEQPDGN